MGMRDNWDRFIEITKSKSKSHIQAARYWDSVYTALSLALIFLGALTTFLALLKVVPSLIVAGVAAVATLISAVNAFLRPGDRRQTQEAASKGFKTLMMRMIRSETEEEYEGLWRELNKEILDEPFIPKKYIGKEKDIEWSITPELQMVIAIKEHELEEAFTIDEEEDDDEIKEQSKYALLETVVEMKEPSAPDVNTSIELQSV